MQKMTFKTINIIFTLGLSTFILALIINSKLLKKELIIPFTETLSKTQITVVFTGFCLTLIMLCVAFILYFQKLNKNNNVKNDYFVNFMSYNWVQKVYSLIHYLLNTLVRAYDFILEITKERYIVELIVFTRKFIFLGNYFDFMIFLTVIFPRIVILGFFVIEIYLQELHYYFYSLTLLLIPLIFRFIIFVVRDTATRAIPQIKDMLIFEPPKRIILNGELVEKTVINLKPEYKHLGTEYIMDGLYMPLVQVEPIMENFLPKYHAYRLSILIIYYFIHVIGWGYIAYIIVS